MPTTQRNRPSTKEAVHPKRAIDYLTKTDAQKARYRSKKYSRTALRWGIAVVFTLTAVHLTHPNPPTSEKPITSKLKEQNIKEDKYGYFSQQGYVLVQEPLDASGKPIQTKKLKAQFKALKETRGESVSYEINGLTDAGWWYQAVLNCNDQDKFSLLYEIWDDTGTSVIPSKGSGSVNFDGKVNVGDDIRGTLEVGDRVYMTLIDLNTGARADKDFERHGNRFVWDKKEVGFSTGFMTETFSWNQVIPDSNRQEYIVSGLPISENNIEFFDSAFKASAYYGNPEEHKRRTIYKNIDYKISDDNRPLDPNFSYVFDKHKKMMIPQIPNKTTLGGSEVVFVTSSSE